MSDADDVLARADEFQRLLEARDAGALADILHRDYALLLMQPDEAAMPRARWLETLPDYVIHEYAIEARRVDVEGDAAAVLQRVTMRATVLGEDRSGALVISDVWRRGDDGTWRLWKRHSTPLTAGRLPGA